MKHYAPVIWLTGMSASGKSTLAHQLKMRVEKYGYKTSIIDGDVVRERDDEKLGFGLDDVKINNMRIADICNIHRTKFDLVIVPVISPYEEVRNEVRKMLEPNFHLVYLKADINSLKDRDPKGLYAASDRGDITDLIGYSEINKYDEPKNAELTVYTGNGFMSKDSFITLFRYVNKVIFIDKYLM